jgi:hypothetical protein
MRSRGRKVGRVVRHTLADGTQKEYRYPPHRPKSRSHRPSDSLSALIEAYQRSPEWRALADATKRNYSIYLRELAKIGHVRAQDFKRRELLLIRDAIAERRGNGAGTGFVRAASALFGWAVGREWIDASPATRIKALEGGTLRAWRRCRARGRRRAAAAPPGGAT